MSSRPTDTRWPPSGEIDFDAIVNRLMGFKRLWFPEHTSKDPSDPLVQVLYLVAAVGQHGFRRANSALKQLSPKTATSRRALISLMELANRPLVPMMPSRGVVYAKLSADPTVSTVVISKGDRIMQQNSADPVFTVDEDVSTGDSVDFSIWVWDSSADSTSAVTLATPVAFDAGDAWIIGFTGLQFDAVELSISVGHTSDQHKYCLEYRNNEWGPVDSITNATSQLRFDLSTYLHSDTVDVEHASGLVVKIRYKATNVEETVTTEVYLSTVVAVTSFMGQTSPSTSTFDYEVFSEWRPVPSGVDGTSGFYTSGTLSFSIADVRSDTDWWYEDDTFGYALRLRHAADPAASLPDNITIDAVNASDGTSFYATANITQGYLATFVVGQTDGTSFQRLPMANALIKEPVEDPAITITVGSDTDWSVVEDFGDSGPASKYAIIREDVDDGWCLMFGDGTIGMLPDSGSSVKMRYRTGSANSGDIDAGTSIKANAASGLVKSWVLPRATSGFAVPECTTKEDALRFRAVVIPQLALRQDSVVTPSEIETAIAGGVQNRASFETSDGRVPFSRAAWTSDGAGVRQYRVIVVGSDSDQNGDVSSADLTEAEEWLNGTRVGIQTVGGHGPQNTEGVVCAYTPRLLRPTVTVTISSSAGVVDQADQIIRSIIRPHAKDDNGEWRWQFGGTMPVAALFGKLWDGIKGRTLVTLSITDGVTTYALNDSIELESTELPALSLDYDKTTDIVVVVA